MVSKVNAINHVVFKVNAATIQLVLVILLSPSKVNAINHVAQAAATRVLLSVALHQFLEPLKYSIFTSIKRKIQVPQVKDMLCGTSKVNKIGSRGQLYKTFKTTAKKEQLNTRFLVYG